MSEGPDPGTVIVAMFLIVAGACLALVGGGCTIWLLSSIFSYGGEAQFALLLLGISGLAFAVGAFMVWGGMKLLRRRDG